jgi:predicted transcriptional regulator
MEIGEETVSSIMNRNVELIHEGSPIDDVLRGCSERRIIDLIVVDSDDRYMGMVTAFEILSYINPFMGIHSGRKTMGHTLVMGQCPEARDLMTRAHLTVREDTTLEEALRHMRKDHHRYLVVLDDDDRVIGRLDLCDIVSLLIEREVILPSDICRV